MDHALMLDYLHAQRRRRGTRRWLAALIVAVLLLLLHYTFKVSSFWVVTAVI
jgi:hypothetical protein